MYTGRVSRVGSEKGWCYVACTKCSRKLQRTQSAFTCVRCDNSYAAGVLLYVTLFSIEKYFSIRINTVTMGFAYNFLSYQVEFAIADDTAEGVFVCSDAVITK